MITDAILNVVLAFVRFLWGLVPEWTVAVPPGVGGFASVLSQWDGLLPFTELMQITTVVQVLFGVFVIVRLVQFVAGLVTNAVP